MQNSFQNTALWKNGFHTSDDDSETIHRERLKQSFLSIRNNAAVLVERISNLFPNLTIHDITHLDHLWDVAETLAGKNYPLNPLETYILGCSFLFHDAAMCWEAYDKGKEGVRSTTQWKDAYADELSKNASQITSIEENSDFRAIRELHAHQAEKLPFFKVNHPDSSDEIFIISDPELRCDLGEIIGKISASHHWDIETLTQRLQSQINPPESFPKSWVVDPIKVACLLRCADAADFNSGRAPLFLYSLISRKGLSRQHWIAQNKIHGPNKFLEEKSQNTAAYTSSTGFTEDQSEAWWIIFDTISMIQKELTESNKVLSNRSQSNSPPFQIEKIYGADNAAALNRVIPTFGWTPYEVLPHVSNVESLVRELGGKKLYGDSTNGLEIALRELLQNSRDAIAARRSLESEFEGCITIEVESINEDTWITISDDGIGMSKSTLTGPLLDFGTSFWKSNLVLREFPGLRSSKFRPIGKFGIGFYSIFMAADYVEVSSKRWDEGSTSRYQLRFKNNASLRPTLAAASSGFISTVSTATRFKVRRGLLNPDFRWSTKANVINSKEFSLSFDEFIESLVVGIDVDISIKIDGQKHPIVRSQKIDFIDAKRALKAIAFSESNPNPGIGSLIDAFSQKMRPIIEDEKLLGIAAIATTVIQGTFLSTTTIGGIASPSLTRNEDAFVGYIDHYPNSAARHGGQLSPSIKVLKEWCEEQFDILEKFNVSDSERAIAGIHSVKFGADPILFSRILISAENSSLRFVSYAEAAKICIDTPLGVLRWSVSDHIDVHHSIRKISEGFLIIPVSNGSALDLSFDKDQPKNPNTIIGCLYRSIKSIGMRPELSITKNYTPSFAGTADLLLIQAVPK